MCLRGMSPLPAGLPHWPRGALPTAAVLTYVLPGGAQEECLGVFLGAGLRSGACVLLSGLSIMGSS